MNHSKIKEYENDWAHTVEQDRIHISQAKRGKNGYYCLGCNEEMQAVKPKENIQPYFRHDATNVTRDKAKCVLASRTYREKIARNYFFRTKQIELPALYKFPPYRQDGEPNLLNEKYLHHTSKIIEELTFYENEGGQIHYGSNPEIEERFNLMRPDLTFFDDDGNPSLLIELVVTHKVSDEKKDKIRRLGINCVQVIIPKKDVLEIEKHLAKSSSYKWLYNEIEANTTYISVFGSDKEELPQTDEEQRRLLEESYTCRKSEISNLVRSIERSFRTESYKGVERHFRSEISRIENATESLKREYEQEERKLEQEARGSFSKSYEKIRSKQEQIDEEQREEDNRYSNLERRYLRKRTDIEWEQSDTEQEQVNHAEAIRREREYLEEHRTERKVRTEIEGKEKEVRSIEEKEGEAIRELRKRIVQPRNKVISRIRSDIEKRERLLEKNEFAYSAGGGFEGLKKQIAKRINERDISGNDELSERIRTVLEIRRICRDFEDRRKLEQELKTAKR